MSLRICHISDTHNRHKKITIPECDVLVHSGDFTGTGEKHEVLDFLKWWKSQTQATYKILVAGNHDISFDEAKDLVDEEKPLWLQEALREYTKLDALNFYLQDSACEIEGVKFWGSPYTPRFGSPRWAFNADRGWHLRIIWNQIPDDTDVLITHGPPLGILDLVPDYTTTNGFFRAGGNQGCAELLDRVKWIEPKAHLFGHIHEDYGQYSRPDLKTRFFNSSICDIGYVPNNEPQIFEI